MTIRLHSMNFSIDAFRFMLKSAFQVRIVAIISPYFDNLSVIPEPSILMVGLTGLAAAGLDLLLKRHRKA